MNPLERIEAAVSRLELASRREQLLQRRLLAAVFVFVSSVVISWGGFSWR